MQRNVRLRLLSNVVIAFMLIAIAWWSYLLFIKNREAFKWHSRYDKVMMIADGVIQTNEQFLQTEQYQTLESKYKRQEWMIMTESLVFVISMIIGVWMINKGYNRQIEAAQERRNFLLSITHELKSPIASIRLVLDTFLKRKLKPEQVDKLSNNALKETERLNKLVNDLLLAAKVETAYTPHLEEINLSQFLKDIIDRLQAKYGNVQFEFRQPQNPVMVAADRTGLASVAVNLLENAVKYGSTTPIISTVLREDKSNQNIWLEVADNGIGIPNKDKAKVFERFYRVGSEDTRKTKGTGLGLYIVDQIIQAHRGSIAVTDNRPQGTIFTISLPTNDS
ncbi:MAG: HAMP domain-containing sensor histidine kinase [Bacteroidota bacterium]